jgi:hypothetical protein
MRIGTRFVCASALLFSTLVTACAAGSGSSEPDIGAIAEIRDARDIVLPLDPYSLNPKEYVTARRAMWRLIRDCLQRFGVDYSLPESAMSDPVPRFEHPHERRYGLIDAASAAARGYNLAPDQLPQKPAETSSWRPSETEQLLIGGTPATPTGTAPPIDAGGQALPPGGCQGEADRTLAAGQAPPANESLGSELALEGAKRAESDSRRREAMTRWSECMRRRGHPYGSVWEPNDRDWPDPAGPEEIATAQADVGCKHETNLTGVWFSVESAHHRQLIQDRAPDLDAVLRYARTMAASAARLVGG